MDETSEGRKPVWDRRWFQTALAILVVAAMLVLLVPPLVIAVNALSPVLLPILIGLGLAYAANPLVNWLWRRVRVPRIVSAAVLLLLVPVAFGGAVAYLIVVGGEQIRDFIENAADYADMILAAMGVEPEAFAEWLEETTGMAEDADVTTVAANLWEWAGGLEMIGHTVGLVLYGVVATLLVGVCFIGFLWKFDQLTAGVTPLMPVDHRDEIMRLAGRMDAAVSSFIRGRMLQALIVGCILSFGWWLVDVPYWLLLGVLGGVLNIIPYAVSLTWPLAVVLAWVSGVGGEEPMSLWWVLLAPSVVYWVAQLTDNWLVEPLVQGQATNMDPLTVLVVVIAGGTLAGLVGMLLAIPLAACGKILLADFLLPRWRRWAAGESEGAEAEGGGVG